MQPFFRLSKLAHNVSREYLLTGTSGQSKTKYRSRAIRHFVVLQRQRALVPPRHPSPY